MCLKRILFALRHRTLKPVIVDPENQGRVIAFHESGDVSFPRRCPHQGASLENGKVEKGRLICPWHGCFYDLASRKFCPKTFVLTSSEHCSSSEASS